MRDEDAYFADREERHRWALSRRQLLKAGAVARLGGLLAPAPSPAARRRLQAPPAAAGPIVKPLPPGRFDVLGTNAEMRWDAAADLPYTIPNERFFVRNHTATPAIDAATWRLSVFGSGLNGQPGPDRAIQFSLEDLRALPAQTITAAIECAGNGRSFFASQQGTPFNDGGYLFGAVVRHPILVT